jgi:hypothetical protein
MHQAEGNFAVELENQSPSIHFQLMLVLNLLLKAMALQRKEGIALL